MKQTKYNYFKVIQQNYGFGFEDVSAYTCNSSGITDEKHTTTDGKKIPLIKHDLREYQKTGYTTRVIKRKELNPNFKN